MTRMGPVDAAVCVRRIRTDDTALARRLRLAALADAPAAFEATLAEELAFPPAVWEQRTAANADGSRTVGFLALVSGRECGLVVALRDDPTPGAARLVSLWVEPGCRGRGAASALVEAVCDHARAWGCRVVALDVTEGNAAARALYRACGFVETGERGPCGAAVGRRMVRALRARDRPDGG